MEKNSKVASFSFSSLGNLKALKAIHKEYNSKKKGNKACGMCYFCERNEKCSYNFKEKKSDFENGFLFEGMGIEELDKEF